MQVFFEEPGLQNHMEQFFEHLSFTMNMPDGWLRVHFAERALQQSQLVTPFCPCYCNGRDFEAISEFSLCIIFSGSGYILILKMYLTFSESTRTEKGSKLLEKSQTPWAENQSYVFTRQIFIWSLSLWSLNAASAPFWTKITVLQNEAVGGSKGMLQFT